MINHNIYSSDDDVHQCGRCKEVFHDITNYMKHKSSKVCKNNVNKLKVDASQPQQQQQQQQQQQSQPKQQNEQQAQQQQGTPNKTGDPSSGSVISLNNQNILEAAAKNTIFRDSFISMTDQQQQQQQVSGDSLEKETDSFTDDLWNDKDKDPNEMLMNQDDINGDNRKSKYIVNSL